MARFVVSGKCFNSASIHFNCRSLKMLRGYLKYHKHNRINYFSDNSASSCAVQPLFFWKSYNPHDMHLNKGLSCESAGIWNTDWLTDWLQRVRQRWHFRCFVIDCPLLAPCARCSWKKRHVRGCRLHRRTLDPQPPVSTGVCVEDLSVSWEKVLCEAEVGG